MDLGLSAEDMMLVNYVIKIIR